MLVYLLGLLIYRQWVIFLTVIGISENHGAAIVCREIYYPGLKLQRLRGHRNLAIRSHWQLIIMAIDRRFIGKKIDIFKPLSRGLRLCQLSTFHLLRGLVSVLLLNIPYISL